MSAGVDGRGFVEAAAFLGCSEGWLRKNSTKLPRHKYGKTVVFTDDDLEAIARRFAIRPDSDALGEAASLRPARARLRRPPLRSKTASAGASTPAEAWTESPT